jgi:predicted ArsR family transcriptional regulator
MACVEDAPVDSGYDAQRRHYNPRAHGVPTRRESITLGPSERKPEHVPKRTNKYPDLMNRRRSVLRILTDATTPLSIVDIAGRLDIHPNTVRFHLDTLVKNGQVKRVEVDRRVPGRPPQLFEAVRQMDPNGPRHYRLLAEVLALDLATTPDSDVRAVEAGRAWGRHKLSSSRRHEAMGSPTESVTRLVTLLDDMGFAPERREDQGGEQIGLRNCPFLELASTEPQIVCRIHLGLMQGAMDGWQSPVAVDRLSPFVEPDLCVAHLTRTKPAS